MALSADREVPRKIGNFAHHPVAAAKKIYEGAFVSINAAGYALPFVASSGDVAFAGIARKLADNSGGSAGAITVEVERGTFHIEHTLTSAAQADVGDAVYASADDTVTKSSTNNLLIGKISGYVGTNTAELRLTTDI